MTGTVNSANDTWIKYVYLCYDLSREVFGVRMSCWKCSVRMPCLSCRCVFTDVLLTTSCENIRIETDTITQMIDDHHEATKNNFDWIHTNYKNPRSWRMNITYQHLTMWSIAPQAQLCLLLILSSNIPPR